MNNSNDTPRAENDDPRSNGQDKWHTDPAFQQQRVDNYLVRLDIGGVTSHVGGQQVVDDRFPWLRPVADRPSLDCCGTRVFTGRAEPVQWCADESYARDLLGRRYDPHVAPINHFVDMLRRVHPDRFIPYVAPTFGGTNARMLALFQDPGPMTNPRNPRGSGMLCVENADETAARHKSFLAEYKIDTCDILSWNAYPWYGPTCTETRRTALARMSWRQHEPYLNFCQCCPTLRLSCCTVSSRRRHGRDSTSTHQSRSAGA